MKRWSDPRNLLLEVSLFSLSVCHERCNVAFSFLNSTKVSTVTAFSQIPPESPKWQPGGWLEYVLLFCTVMEDSCSSPTRAVVSVVTGPSDLLPHMQTRRGTRTVPSFFPKGHHGGFKDSSLPLRCLHADLRMQEILKDCHFLTHLKNRNKMKEL